MIISGTTRLIGFVGDPVQQARTPEILNSIFEKDGIDAVCVPLNVGNGGIPALLKGAAEIRNLDGLIATIPHKFVIAESADELGPNASFVRVANVIKRVGETHWMADLFDGVGFVEGLRSAGISVDGRSFLLIGAGGGGSAIAGALMQAGAGPLSIADVDASRMRGLVQKLNAFKPDAAVAVDPETVDPGGFDLIVNATPLGMRETDPLPLNPSRLSRTSIVADIIMKPRVTRLLSEAEKRGCRIHLGHHMIDNQIPEFIDFFGYGKTAASVHLDLAKAHQ